MFHGDNRGPNTATVELFASCPSLFTLPCPICFFLSAPNLGEGAPPSPSLPGSELRPATRPTATAPPCPHSCKEVQVLDKGRFKLAVNVLPRQTGLQTSPVLYFVPPKPHNLFVPPPPYPFAPPSSRPQKKVTNLANRALY